MTLGERRRSIAGQRGGFQIAFLWPRCGLLRAYVRGGPDEAGGETGAGADTRAPWPTGSSPTTLLAALSWVSKPSTHAG
jgi:hypothetical protein